MIDSLMSTPFQKEILWPTPKGNIRVRSFCTPEQIREHIFDDEFRTYAQYKSLYTKRETLEKKAETPDTNVTLALSIQKHIIGFGVLDHPEPDERWAALGPGKMMEINVVEVCRSWRSYRVAGKILKLALDHPRIEEMVAYMVGYSWTWDLDSSGMNAQQYRMMLIRLFNPFGFDVFETNEPNICIRSENLFMARIGKKVTSQDQHRFKWIRFGISQPLAS